MRVLGLDLSLTSTGICRPDGTTRAIKVKSTGMQRLNDLDVELGGELDALGPPTGPYNVDLVAIEGYSFGSRNGGEKLGEWGGLVRYHLWLDSVPYVEVPPTCVKKYATGKGNGSKDQVLTAIASRTGIAFETSDECDAWVLWAMAMDHYGEPVTVMPAVNRTALAGVEWPELPERN